VIFVTVGTNEAPFDRLLRAAADLPRTEELVVQYGSSSVRPADAVTFDFLSFDRVVEHMRRARVVVTHAGVGSTLVALANGKKPVVVPRLKSFGEAVDDHQLFFGRRFAGAGLVTLVESPLALEDALDGEHSLTALKHGAGPLALDLRRFLEEKTGRSTTLGAISP